jgi:Tfp pilus assembly protein PilV
LAGFLTVVPGSSRHRRRAAPTPRCRGITLVEALVALVVMSLGLMALARVQAGLRLEADMSRQRAEAVRLAQQDLEALRAFGTLAGFDAIADVSGQAVQALDGATVYTLDRSVVELAATGAKALTVTVGWTDRRGQMQSVTLQTLLSRTDPATAGQVSVAPAASRLRNPFSRNVQIPTTAVDLGGGRSGFRPPGLSAEDADVYFVFDNLDASVIEKCRGTLSAAGYAAAKAGSSGSCTILRGQLLSGFVNFDLSAAQKVSAIDPATSVCGYHLDLRDAGLLGPPTPPLTVSRRHPPEDEALRRLLPRTAGSVWAAAVVLGSSSRPLDGDSSVATNQSLRLDFDSTTLKNIHATELVSPAAVVLRVRGGATVETFTAPAASTADPAVEAPGSMGGSLGLSGSRMTITPGSALAAETVYELSIPSGTVRLRQNPASFDLYGGTTLVFSTGPGPRLVSSLPAAGSGAASLDGPIRLDFDRPVFSSAGVVSLQRRSRGNNWATVETFNVVDGRGGSGGTLTGLGGSTLLVDPAADLQDDSEYALRIEKTALRDADGIRFPGITDHDTLRFSTSTGAATGCPTAQTVQPFIGMHLDVTASNGSALQHECFDDSSTAATLPGERAVGYVCVVYATSGSGEPPPWSGTARVTGPSGWLSGATARYRVCRYHDHNGNGVDDGNAEHPAVYTAVSGALSGQNFLVVRQASACPDQSINVGSLTGVVVYFNTETLQP